MNAKEVNEQLKRLAGEYNATECLDALDSALEYGLQHHPKLTPPGGVIAKLPDSIRKKLKSLKPEHFKNAHINKDLLHPPDKVVRERELKTEFDKVFSGEHTLNKKTSAYLSSTDILTGPPQMKTKGGWKSFEEDYPGVLYDHKGKKLPLDSDNGLGKQEFLGTFVEGCESISLKFTLKTGRAVGKSTELVATGSRYWATKEFKAMRPKREISLNELYTKVQEGYFPNVSMGCRVPTKP